MKQYNPNSDNAWQHNSSAENPQIYLQKIIAAADELLSRINESNKHSLNLKGLQRSSNPGKPLTVKEAAAFFQVSLQTIHNWRARHIIKSVKVGRRTYFLPEELQEVLKRKKAA